MKALLAALALSVFAVTASADSVWTYTGNTLSWDSGIVPLPGNPVTICSGGIRTCPYPASISPYALDGTVLLNAADEVTAWRFTAGPLTLTNFNSTGEFSFGEGLSGALPGLPWAISLDGAGGAFIITRFNGSISDAMDFGSDFGVRSDPGTWAETVATPEPGTLALLGIGLLGLLARKRSKPAISASWEPLA